MKVRTYVVGTVIGVALLLLTAWCFHLDTKTLAIEAIMAARNEKSLDFYGKTVDQNGQPVGGVKVTARVGWFLGITHSGGKNYDTESDSAGRFSFIGIHGAGTGFTLQKEGYTYDQRLPSSSRPDDYKPDPNNPVIFKMWKLKGAESMIYARIHDYIPCDGTQTGHNLLTGKISNGGDFVVTLTRNPVNINRGKPFDWTLTLSIANGGLVEISDLYPYEAPVEGYQPSITITMSANDKNWNSSLSRSYYFQSGGGQTYGRMTINVTANFQPPPTLFDAYIYVNPSGSRNLEFDETKQINR